MRRYNLPGDRALLKNLLAEIPPVSLTYGGRRMALSELSPQIEREALDETRTRTLFSAALDKHMTLRVERVDYADFPAAEWTAFVENHGEAPSALLEDFCVFDGALRGENPVLLHGNGEDMGVFAAQTPVFAEKYRVITVDSRGHGKSVACGVKLHISDMADDLVYVLDAAGVDRANILGFSDGGNVAMVFASRYPERVKSLILSGANADPSGLRFKYYCPMLLEQRFLTIGTIFSKKACRKKEYLDLMVLEPELRRPELQRITAPTLITAGEKDMITRLHTDYLHVSIQGSQLKIFPGGHFTIREHPEEYNRAVLEFLAQVN